MLCSQGVAVSKVAVLQDNTATLALINAGRGTTKRSRHIDIRHFFVRDLVEKGLVVLEHCRTEDMLADALTKPLQGSKFVKMRDNLLGIDAPAKLIRAVDHDCDHKRSV
ncbi:Copia protein [Porphyridium purpureum]|uniref:Copia protein n=1 Tax=Porphyridium purpureum TaxID=35688 RepID=A0A5J4Z0Q7_PORPP|nr:Copia protein [Porphyridium purpureum]|eukprot:POR3506..scf208_2